MIRHPTWADLPNLLRCEAEFSLDMRWTLNEYIRGQYQCLVYGIGTGAIWFGQTGDRLEIVSVAVWKAGQGSGRGRLLMKAAHAWGRELGLKKAFLDVLEHNTRARCLYTSLGYRNVGRTARNALRMQVAL